MKKTIFIIISLFVCVLNIFSQNEIISKEKYDLVMKEAAAKAENLPNRKTMIAKFYSGKDITQIRTTISEMISSDKRRNYFKVEQKGKITDLIESITIGNVQYRKKLNEDWIKDTLSSNGFGSRGGGMGIEIKSRNLDEYFVSKSKINNQESNIYVNFNAILTENYLYFIENQKWINSDGLIIRSVVKVSKIVPENITSISITDYEYNPKDLNIEAPIK